MPGGMGGGMPGGMGTDPRPKTSKILLGLINFPIFFKNYIKIY
jgi:hypothetical protein